jgi:hypothetical protein
MVLYIDDLSGAYARGFREGGINGGKQELISALLARAARGEKQTPSRRLKEVELFKKDSIKMGYIPKKMTNNNLYTAGDQFVDPATGNTYTGSYYELFDGTVFSGKTPNDPNSRKLLVDYKSVPQNTKVITSNENLRYQKLNPTNQELYKYGKDPIAFIPQPTGDDYKRGSIQRYVL